MVILATVISIVLAIAIGVYAALRQNKLGDHVATVTNFVFLAAPVFVIGLLLKEFVAIPINQHVGSTAPSSTPTVNRVRPCPVPSCPVYPTTPPTPPCPRSR